MKTVTVALMLIVMPVSAFAASINSVTSAEADSGGSVAPGGTTMTGDSSASANVHTLINSNTGVSDVKVEVETRSNGAVEKHIGRFSASSTAHAPSVFFAWFDWMLPPHLSERVISLPQESSTTVSLEEDQGTFGFPAFFRRFVDRLLTFW